MNPHDPQKELESPTEATPVEDVTSVGRVWMDGTRSGGDEENLVEPLLGRAVLSEQPEKQATRRRRTGLGRGLGDLIPNGDSDTNPTQSQPSVERRPTIVCVAVVESTSGLSLEVEDGAGGVYTAPIGDAANSDRAVVDVVRLMVDAPQDIRVNVTDLETEEGSIVMATAVRGDDRSVGSAFVGFGRPFAVARAVLNALCDIRSLRDRGPSGS